MSHNTGLAWTASSKKDQHGKKLRLVQFLWENKIPIRPDQFALLIIVMMMREYGLLKEADAWISTCKWYSCFGSKFMRRSWNSSEQQQAIWRMLPPPGTKLEKQKPGNLEYRQNQGETEGGKLIEEETNTWRWTSPEAQDPLHRKKWIKKDMSCWEEIQKNDQSTSPRLEKTTLIILSKLQKMLTGWLISFYGLLDFVAETKGRRKHGNENTDL